MQKIEKADAQALLQSTQQLRTHLSGVIVNLINYVIVLNAAIWSFFLKAYIDSFTMSCNAQPLYIVIASVLSVVSLGAWRLYTHYLDDNITKLYPELLFYEKVLQVPHDYGTARYLKKFISRLNHVLPISEIKYKERLISKLVEKKRVGSRGHRVFDLIAMGFVILFIYLTIRLTPFCWLQMIEFPDLSDFKHQIFYIIFLVYLLSILIMLRLLFYQRFPSKRFIKKTLKKLKEEK